jgi:hypothetical protein
VPPDRKSPDNGLLGDSLEKGLLSGGSDIPFTSIGVLTPNTDDRALGLVITSSSRTRGAGALDLQNIGCLGGPEERIGVVVVHVDVVAARKSGYFFGMTFS